MPNDERETLEFPVGRWLLWGLVALGGLALIVFLLTRLGDDVEEDAGATAQVEQIEWSIVLTDMTGDTITLKGDLPRGAPTETWQEDFMVDRNTSGSDFDWDLDAGLPAPVVEIDGVEGCDGLNQQLGVWAQEIEAAQGDAQHWQARAFTQHTLDRMRSSDCPIDDSALTGL